ncbi:MAG TPA: 8-oxo-dGTP diphosphatase [bacterium]
MISQRVLCFLERDQRFLLLHRRRPPNAGLWNAIGGKIEPGEDPYTACTREIREETGLEISSPSFRALLVVTVRETGDLWVIYVFHAPAPSGETIASDEGDLRWVDVDEIRSLSTPADLPLIVRRLRDGSEAAIVRLHYETEAGPPSRIEIVGS